MFALRLFSRPFFRQNTRCITVHGRTAGSATNWATVRTSVFPQAQGKPSKQVARVEVSRNYSSSFRERRRFYKSADVEQLENGFQVAVDKKAAKTPAGNSLIVPSKQLATAIAVEWNSQEGVIIPENMLLTSLSNTVIDVPRKRTQVEQVEDLMEFLFTDTVCFHAEEPDELVELQSKEWGALLDWFCDRFKVSVPSVSTLLTGNVPESSVEKIKAHLTSINHWALTGLEYSVETAKSLVISLALVENHVSVERAAYLSRLELEFQIERWGTVEWAHDVDLMEVRSRLAAAALFYHLTADATDS